MGKPRRPPAAAMGEEDRLALEMWPGLERFHGLLGVRASGLRGSDTVQLREVASEGDQRRRGVGPCGAEPLKLGERLCRIAAARRVDEILERRLRGVSDD